MKKNKAFTLIELMVAIAIVGILAAVVMVQMSSYGKKARASRTLAQASSVIPSMVSCWGNGGDTTTGTPGNSVCSLGSGYGSWPILPSGYTAYSGTNIISANSKNPWSFSVTNTEGFVICCNSTMNSCAVVDSCNAGKTW